MSCEKVVKLKKNRLGRGFIGMRFSFREWILEQYRVTGSISCPECQGMRVRDGPGEVFDSVG